MYDSKFVLSIIHDGQPVREVNRVVHLPFNSEYKIRLKNKDHSLRAKARVWVDGRKASNLGDLVLTPGDTLDLERFLDSSLSSGNRFKFVPLGDSRVNDPSDPQNGIVKVEFYRETPAWNDWQKNNPWNPKKIVPLTPSDPKIWPKDFDKPYPDPYWYKGDLSYTCHSQSSGKGTSSSCATPNSTLGALFLDGSTPAAINFLSHHGIVPSVQEAAGATVEGSFSGQAFTLVNDFRTDCYPVTLILTIRGLETPKPSVVYKDYCSNKTPKVRFCAQCGARRRKKVDRFCWRCGNSYVS